jgi:hypothetical protein
MTATVARQPSAQANRPWRRVVTLVGIVALAAAGCSSGSRSAGPTTTTTAAETSSSTTTPPLPDGTVFATVDGAIDAYLAVPPYTRQRVAAAGTAPDGNEPHGQICFAPDGSRRFVVAEGRPAGSTPASAGWGLYQLTGSKVGSLRARRVTGWTSPSNTSTSSSTNSPTDAPTTYGCAFLTDGRLLTTDLGNERAGAPTGRLVEWLPPFGPDPPASCVLRTDLATPLGLSADNADNVYLASARTPTTAGCVTATTGPAPANTTTTSSPSGGSPPDTTAGGPAAVTATLVIPPADGPSSAPTAVAVGPAGSPGGDRLIVTSAPFGAITAYQPAGTMIGPLLAPDAGTTGMVATTPFPGGSPLGVALAPDGSIYYADPGFIQGPDGVIAPAEGLGSIRRLTPKDTAGSTSAPTSGSTSSTPPDPLNTKLHAPDGIGLYLPVSVTGGSASKA